MKNHQKKQIDFSKAVGKTTHVRFAWKSFKEELPPAYVPILVIFKTDEGKCKPLPAVFHDEKFESDLSGSPKTVNFKFVRLNDWFEVYLKSKEAKRLIAWAKYEMVEGEELV